MKFFITNILFQLVNKLIPDCGEKLATFDVTIGITNLEGREQHSDVAFSFIPNEYMNCYHTEL